MQGYSRESHMMSALRRSARLTPSTPVQTKSAPTKSAPMKSAPMKSVPTKSVPTNPYAGYHDPELVAARAAAAALYPNYTKEYYEELEKSPALHKYRQSVWDAEASISKGW